MAPNSSVLFLTVPVHNGKLEQQKCAKNIISFSKVELDFSISFLQFQSLSISLAELPRCSCGLITKDLQTQIKFTRNWNKPGFSFISAYVTYNQFDKKKRQIKSNKLQLCHKNLIEVNNILVLIISWLLLLVNYLGSANSNQVHSKSK